MHSPTMELILSRAKGDGAGEQPSEVDRLRSENAVLRRKLANLTAQYIWAEGGSFAKIDQEIWQYGFRLDSSASSSRDPRIIPL